MKKIAFLSALLLSGLASSVNAQEMLRGRVVDKSGNPIPGAKVECTTTGQSATTDIDGRYALKNGKDVKRIRVSYAGLQSVRCKAEPGAVVKMRNSNIRGVIGDKFRLGVTGGMNLSNITHFGGDNRVGFNAGVLAEYNLTNNLYFNLGLTFTQKGQKGNYYWGNNSESNPGYFEVPLHAGYRFGLGNQTYLFVETGPYFAYGFCGEVKNVMSWYEGVASFYDYDFFGNNDSNYYGIVNKFDCGWGLNFGLEIHHIQLRVGYEYGFSKVWETYGYRSDATYSSYIGNKHNSNFSINVAYLF